MLCISVILRKQWTENERLTYPIVQLPLQITSENAFQPGGLFRNKIFWMGFVVAGLIDTINSLNYYYPSIPTVFTPGFGQSFLDVGPLSYPKALECNWLDTSLLLPIYDRVRDVYAS